MQSRWVSIGSLAVSDDLADYRVVYGCGRSVLLEHLETKDRYVARVYRDYQKGDHMSLPPGGRPLTLVIDEVNLSHARRGLVKIKNSQA